MVDADAPLSPAKQVAAAILETCVSVDFTPMEDDAAIESLMGDGLELDATLDMDAAVALIEAYGEERVRQWAVSTFGWKSSG